MPTPRSKDNISRPPELPQCDAPDGSPVRRQNEAILEGFGAIGDSSSSQTPWQYEELVTHDTIVSMMQHFYATGYAL